MQAYISTLQLRIILNATIYELIRFRQELYEWNRFNPNATIDNKICLSNLSNNEYKTRHANAPNFNQENHKLKQFRHSTNYYKSSKEN